MRAKFVNEELEPLEQNRDYQRRIESVKSGIKYMFNDEAEAEKELKKIVNSSLDFKSDFNTGEVEISGMIDGKPIYVTGLEARTIFHFLYWVKLIGWKDWEKFYDHFSEENGFQNYFLVKEKSFEDPKIDKKREEFNKIGAAKSFGKALNKNVKFR
jgi:hypothetical protein